MRYTELDTLSTADASAADACAAAPLANVCQTQYVLCIYLSVGTHRQYQWHNYNINVVHP